MVIKEYCCADVLSFIYIYIYIYIYQSLDEVAAHRYELHTAVLLYQLSMPDLNVRCRSHGTLADHTFSHERSQPPFYSSIPCALILYPEDGGSDFLRHAGTFPPNWGKSQSRRTDLNEGITKCLDTFYNINVVRRHNCFYYTR